MKESIKELLKVVAPPAEPVKAEHKPRWEKVQKELGTKLPVDYLEYAQRYGSGSFVQEGVDETWIWNPLSDGYVAFVKKKMQSLRDAGLLGEYRPFPSSPGLIPVGTNDVPFNIFYLTDGEPDRWPILAQGEDSREFHRYDMPLTQFLVRIFKGAKETPPWPKGWFKQARIYFNPESTQPPPARSQANIYELYIKNGNKSDFWVTHPDYGNALYHVKKVGGKAKGPLKGEVPDYGNAPVVADIWEEGEQTVKDDELDIFASYKGFILVDPPSSAKPKKARR